MIESLREILTRRESGLTSSRLDPCPEPAKLVNMSRLTMGTTDDYRDLSWHLLRCYKCAQRWEILQSDPHLQFLEILSVSKESFSSDEEGQLLRLRARLHMKHCRTCSEKKELIARSLVEGARMVGRVEAAVERWLASRLSAAYRGGPDKLIVEAQLVDQDGQPVLTTAGTLNTEEVTLTVASALTDPDCALAIDVEQIPQGWNSVRLMLVDTDALIDLDWTTVAEGRGTFPLSTKKHAWVDTEKLSAQDFVVLLKAEMTRD